MNHMDDIHLENRGKLIGENKDLLEQTAFLEFGVYHGTSMLMWHGLYERYDVSKNFIGFDSFQGIPEETEDENSIDDWKEGSFSTNGVINPDLCKPDIRLVKGFFSDSLTDDVVKMLGGTKVGLVHMDCDTYSSTKTIWEWLLKHDLLAFGALVVYDDWGGYLKGGCGEYDLGEAKAHREIEAEHNIHFTDLGRYIVDPTFYVVKMFRYEDYFS